MFYGAFLTPILAVILFNVVMFICVVVVLIKHTKKRFNNTKDTHNSHSKIIIVRFLISIFSIMNLYGFSWVFGALVVSGDQSGSFALQLIFTLLNSFQGFFIFIFFCVLGKDAREAWKEVLCRGKLKSKFYPSTDSRPKTFKQQAHNQYGTNSRYNQTSSTLLRTTQTGTLLRTLVSNTLTSDTTSVVSTLDLRTLYQGDIPSHISEVRNEIEIEEHIRLDSLTEVVNEAADATREQQIVDTETDMVFENAEFEGRGDDQTESQPENEHLPTNATRLSSSDNQPSTS